MKAFLRFATMRAGMRGPAGLAAAAMLAVLGCSDPTGVEPVAPETVVPPTSVAAPRQVVFSLSSVDMGQLASVAEEDDGVNGPRWCNPGRLWFDPAAETCRSQSQSGPMGEVTMVDGAVRIAAGVGRGAPFIWTGSPTRANPFPASGDFDTEIRVTVESLGNHGTGVWLLHWDPASVAGGNTPFSTPVLRIWADWAHKVRVQLLDSSPIKVYGSYAEHAYRLTYEDGAYTLFIDETPVLGPIKSDRRPNSTWLGNPIFADWGPGNWTDFRVSELTVSTAAVEEQVLNVSVDVKPGSCSSPLNWKSRGVLPVAIAGVDGQLDVSQIDPATIRLENVPIIRSSLEDVATPDDCDAAGDGVADLTLKFDNVLIAEALAGVQAGETRTLTLTGNLLPEFEGTPITGHDVVIIQK